MTFEQEQELLANNAQLKEQVAKLADALKVMTTTAEPKHVSQADLESGRLRVRPEDIASGAIVIDMPEGEPKEPRQLKDNEIRKSDLNRINAHLKEIADGSMTVVD